MLYRISLKYTAKLKWKGIETTDAVETTLNYPLLLKNTFSLRRRFEFVRDSRLYKAAHSMCVIYFKI